LVFFLQQTFASSVLFFFQTHGFLGTWVSSDLSANSIQQWLKRVYTYEKLIWAAGELRRMIVPIVTKPKAPAANHSGTAVDSPHTPTYQLRFCKCICQVLCWLWGGTRESHVTLDRGLKQNIKMQKHSNAHGQCQAQETLMEPQLPQVCRPVDLSAETVCIALQTFPICQKSALS